MQSPKSSSPFSHILSFVAVLCIGAMGACGDDDGGEDHHGFDTLPPCVDDHISLGEAKAITHCLIDFPDLHGGLADQQACVDWITANGGYADSRDAACTDYFERTSSVLDE